MQPNEDRRFKKDRQRDRAPDAKGKAEVGPDTVGEDRDVEANDKGKQTSNADSRENMEKTCYSVTARAFRSPRLRGCALVSMKDYAHPQPTGSDRKNPGNQTGNERGTQRVHSQE